MAVLEPPPGEVAASGLEDLPGIAPGLAAHTAADRPPGRQPFLAHSFPSPSSHGSAMALRGTETALSNPNPNPKMTLHPYRAYLSIFVTLRTSVYLTITYRQEKGSVHDKKETNVKNKVLCV